MSSDVLAFAAWYLALAVAGLAALPIAFTLLRRLPDRGYALARPIGLLLIGYVFWFLGSLGFLRNDVGGILFATALVAGLGWFWLGRAGWAELRAWLTAQRGAVLGVEVLFLLAFAALAWARTYQPAIHGTEKPMEYMFINSILRSPNFPPQDAWLSGHAISYYYFGYVLIAGLARLTATDAAVAFNLGLALLFGLTTITAHSLVQNLIALALRPAAAPRSANGHRPVPPAAPPALDRAFMPALLGPLFVLLVGNFYGVAQLAYVNGLFPDLQVPVVYYYFGADDPSNAALNADQKAQLPPEDANPGVRFGAVNVWAWLDLKQTAAPAPQPRSTFTWDVGGNWFYGARVMHDRDLTGQETEAIDEMPAFSFILGDMHPHVLALPFAITLSGLALAWLLWGLGDDAPAIDELDLSLAALRRPAILIRLLLAALLLGGLSFLNTWDFPIYLFVTVAALAVGYGLRHGWSALVGAAGRLALLAVGLAIVSVALYFPFYLTFQSQAGGILPNLLWPSRFQQTVVFFGPVLIGAAVYLGWLAVRARAAIDWRAAAWAGGGLTVLLVLVVVVLTVAASLSPTLGGQIDSFIFPLDRAQALTLVIQRRLVDSLTTLFAAVLVGVAAGLVVGRLRRVSAPVLAAPAPLAERVPEVVAAALVTPPDVELDAAEPAVARPWRRRAGNSLQAGAAVPEAARPGLSGADLLRSPAVLMALVMLLTGALLLIGPEWVYLRDNFVTRMNTIFKFYFQTWTLWALVTAFGVWHLWQHARAAVRWTVGVVIGLVAVGGLLYTIPSLYSYDSGFRQAGTLDGMAWFANTYPDDWAGIQWLRANVSGSPVLAEATGDDYQDHTSRMATATGLPNVMGWAGHESQWRGNGYALVGARPGDLATLYQTREWAVAQAVIDQYNIEYVIVGQAEHLKYDVDNARLFQDKFERNMDTVFQQGTLTIFRRKPLVTP